MNISIIIKRSEVNWQYFQKERGLITIQQTKLEQSKPSLCLANNLEKIQLKINLEPRNMEY